MIRSRAACSRHSHISRATHCVRCVLGEQCSGCCCCVLCMMRAVLCWVATACCVWGVAAAGAEGERRAHRVLVVFPAPGRSHGIVGHSVVDILLDEGHEVTYVTPHPGAAPAHPRLTYVDISSVLADNTAGERPRVQELSQRPRPAHRILSLGPQLTRRALAHPAVRRLLADTKQGFDVVIAEWFYSELLAPLGAVFSCPLVWYSAADVSWQTLSLVHAPASPAYSAELQAPHVASPPYSLAHRAYQLWMQIYLSGWKYYVTKFVEIPAYEELYSEPLRVRGRALPPYEALAYNASLLLVNSHPPLGQRVPLPASAHYVGGHHVQVPPPPLPENIQKLLDDARNGAIFFSMGSNLRSSDFPERMKRELVQLFGRLEQTVLWKFEERLDDLPANLHILDWAPQTSILNHPSTVVFITHGGLLSLLEATTFGVPVVGIPLFGDQPLNVALAAARGCAIRVDFTPDLPRRLQDALHEMLGNYSYRECSAAASRVFSSRAVPGGGGGALAHHVAAAVATRGAPHLRSPALDLALWQRLYLDLLLLLLLAMLLLAKLLKLVRLHCATQTEHPHKKDN